eukprot:848993-Lingulodinium_polyedra.AAC.1
MVGCIQPASQRETHRGLDALASVAHGLAEVQRERIEDWARSFRDAQAPWAVVFRAFDFTPWNISVGCLSEQIAPMAQFFQRCAGPGGKDVWKLA